MDNKGFILCSQCVNKIYHDTDEKGRKRYYCSKVDGIVRDGLVFDTTDASACVKRGIFKCNVDED
jgi:Ethanolamine utilization protein EutJ (predicted chaperonin)